ncbi:MAG: MraY family glycosyltransferase [Bacteroidota bacterium]
MPVLPLVLGFSASLVAALVLVPLARDAARRAGWLDAPDDDRKWHPEAVPSAGGVAIVASIAVGLLAVAGTSDVSLGFLSPLVVLGALVVAAVGLWDDLRDASPTAKLLAQLGVAALALAGGVRLEGFDAVLGGGGLALTVSGVLTVVWLVGVMNAVNLIDGMDGLAGGTTAIAVTGLAAVHALHGDTMALLLAVVVVGALLGFLRYNFAPASVFMGDSGSLFLGYLLGVFALRSPAHADPLLALVIPAVVVGVPVLDLVVSVLRRKLTGRPLFAADCDHIHHRLQDRMPTHRATLVLYGLSAVLALGALAMAALPTLAAAAILGAGSLVVYGFLCYVAYLPTPTQAQAFLERRRRRAPVPRPAPPRSGRISDAHLHPASGPER